MSQAPGVGRGRRVVHIAEAFTGGVARHVVELLLGLPGWDQSAIISPRSEPGSQSRSMIEVERLRRTGVSVAICPMTRDPAPRYDFTAVLHILSLLREIRPAIVHCHSAKAGFLGRLAARLAGVPVRIYTPHSLPFHAFMPPRSQDLYRFLERLAGRWTTRMVAVSRSEAAEIRAARLVADSRLHVIPNGVSLRERTISPAEARKKLQIPADRPVILCVAHLRPQKAPLDWIRMAQAVSARRPEAFFLWVGGGQLQPSFSREYRARLSPESFLHLGNQKDPALAYQAASLFALSSLWEGMPYALLDAMAWGLPCVATAVTGCRDLIEEGKTGLLAEPGDPDGLAARVSDLLNDAKKAFALGAAARTMVERDYTVESFLAAHDSLYEDALRMAG